MKITLSNFSFGYDSTLFSFPFLEIDSGQITLLSGENGSGKTTFCRLVSGLEKSFTGKIEFDKKNIKRLSIGEIGKVLVYHKQEPLSNLVGATPEEDLAIWQTGFRRKITEQDTADQMMVLNRFGIADLRKVPFWEQSSGQIKRCGLAALLLNEQKYWLLDEPLNGLDRQSINTLLRILEDRKKSGYGALIVAHQIDTFRDIADRLLMIENSDLVTG